MVEKIKPILYVVFFIGLLLLFFDSFVYSLKNGMYNRDKKKPTEDSFARHVKKIIASISDEKDVEKELSKFYIISILLFAVISGLTVKLFGAASIIFGMIASVLPYIYLRMKLLGAQQAGSYDGEVLIKELRNQYKYNYNNMVYAIDATVFNLPEEHRFSKRALMKLSMRLKTYKTPEELEMLLDDFQFTYGTKWAKMLAQNISSAIADHMDVTEGLDNLLTICQSINEKLEKQKQGATQAASMTKFLSPTFVVLFYAMAVRIISVKEVIHNQFQTRGGVLLFALIIGTTIANLVVSSLINHPKYDI